MPTMGRFERWASRPATAVVLQIVLIGMLLAIFAWAMFRANSTSSTNQKLIAIVCAELVDHRESNQDDHNRLLVKHGLLTSIEDADPIHHTCVEVLERAGISE